jgi:hypothetical protein
VTLISRDDLQHLIQKKGDPSVSIFMPTHRGGADVQQDPIRLKNLLKQAEADLTGLGLRASEARRLLEPAQDLLSQEAFWQHQADGLALFVDGEGVKTYRLPRKFPELVVVGDRFYSRPLIPILTPDGEYYVLTLSQGGVRLFEGTRHTFDDLDVDSLPKDLSDALKYDDPEKQLQWHTGTASPGGQGDRPAMFHGHGVGTDDEKDRIRRYFQKVDAGLKDAIAGEHAPLVLAGLEHLQPIYREANSYPYLVEEGITTNPEDLAGDPLHRQAWKVVEPIFKRRFDQALDRYQMLAGRGDAAASTGLEEIVQAAYGKRVETLFIPMGVRRWGSYDEAHNRIELHDEPQPGDEDLLDFAAVHTVINGGDVYALDPQELPEPGKAAAVFRY